MTGKRNGCGVAALLAVLGLFFGVPLAMLLEAPAIAARIALSGAPGLAPYLQEWLWPALGSPIVALVLVRLVLAGNGRLRGGSMSPVKRWLGMLERAAVLLGVVNVATFVHLTRAGSTDHVIAGDMTLLIMMTLPGIAVLVAIAVWDRRPKPVTVGEVRAAAAEADHTLRRIRTQNERVRRQAERVQARLAKLRAQDRSSARSDVDFHALRNFHRGRTSVPTPRTWPTSPRRRRCTRCRRWCAGRGSRRSTGCRRAARRSWPAPRCMLLRRTWLAPTVSCGRRSSRAWAWYAP
ncbi:MAG: hypothetical protein ACRDSR_06155 [Pseudonocardiaceae bacterium]